ncbi:MAG: hypothetical protein IKI60_04135 [Alloprevotella sp.]|nr:hypothetical protein [Alloprevotella sp.]MBR6375601.1 hypothetical protein [Alloprevotella sp.]
MKKYTYPRITVIELSSARSFADQFSLVEDEGGEQWGRKKSDEFGNKGVGGKLWEDMK